MFKTRLRQFTLTALVATAALVAVPLEADALVVMVGGESYDLAVYTGTYDDFADNFALPTTGGTMRWWGNQTLAMQLATELAAALSPTPTPDSGPVFATSFNALNAGSEVTASYYDLTTLGTTDVVENGTFARNSVQTFAYEAPFPLPVLSVPLCLSATGRLRRLSSRLEQQRGC